MDEDILDRSAAGLLALLFFHHKQLMKLSEPMNGVREAQMRILFLLKKEGTMSMSALGNRLFISKPHMTSLVDTLIRDDLVRRDPDQKDRRVINITITDQGSGYIQKCMFQYKESLKGILADLDTPDLQTLCTSSEKIAEILSKLTELQPRTQNPHKA